MILLILFVAALLSVLVAGGDVRKLGTLGFRWAPLILGALAIQILITTVFRLPHGLSAALYIVSNLLVLAALAANVRIPGMLIVTAGFLLNFVAICANAGVMPAKHSALVKAGMNRRYVHGFMNSHEVKHAKLQFLGDDFAIPKTWPVHNVYSVGDVLIVVGVTIGLHQVCESKLTKAGRRRPDPVSS